MEILRCRNLFLLYVQNLPTVALLLPRVGLSMAFLFTNHLPLQILSFSRRDQNFFQVRRKSNGLRTGILFLMQHGRRGGYCILVSCFFYIAF